MIRGTVVFLFLLTIFSASVQSQDMIPGFSHRQWTVDDGLPINEVIDIDQDSDGYLWLATFDGLVRFDGNLFTTYNRSNTQGLVSNRISGIVRSPDDQIWVSTETVNRKVFKGFFKNGSFESFEFDINPEGSITSLSFYKNNETRLVNNFKIYTFNGQQFIPFQKINTELKVNSIAPDIDSTIWVSTDNGILRIGDKQHMIDVYRDGLSSIDRNQIFVDSQNRVWASTEFGLDYIENGVIHTVRIPSNKENLEFINTKGFEDQSRPGRVIFKLSKEYHLAYYNGETQLIPFDLNLDNGKLGSFTLIGEDDPNVDKSWVLVGNKLFYNGRLVFQDTKTIKRIFDDGSEGVWIARSDGLHHFKKNIFSSFSMPVDGISNIYPIHQDNLDNIWAGDLHGSIYKYHNNKWHDFQKLPDTRVFSIFEDSKKRLWLGVRKGLYRKNRDEENFNIYTTPYGNQNTVIRSIHEDEDTGDIWFGSRYGIFRLGPDDTWSKYDTSAIKKVPIQEVRTIYKTSDNKLWFGTNGAGLFYKKEGNIYAFEANERLSDNIVRSIYQDEDGVIWVGMENGGLNRIEIQDSNHEQISITVYNTSNGLFDDVVHVILEDNNERLWMSGNSGIFWVSRDNLNAFDKGEISRIQSNYYLEEDGLPGNEANGGMQYTGIKNTDGTFWFAMVSGIAVVNPDEVSAEYESTPTIIESLSIKDSTILNPGRSLMLENKERDIQLTYTGINYQVEPKNIQFRYRLNGANNSDWVQSGTRREAFFTNLSAGDYTFTVQASTDGTRWQNSESSVSFTILPFFYETIWFKFFVALSGLVALFTVYSWRTRQLYKRQLELSNLVNERTNDLSLEKREVERQKETIEQLSHSKDRFFANISHELRTPLTLVLGPLKQLQDSGEINDQRLNHLLSIAGKNGLRLQELVEQVLDVTRLDSGTIKTNFESLDILEYLNFITESFQSQCIEKGVSLTAELPSGTVIIWADRDKFQKIIVNLISNALKFTSKGGSIVVSLNENGDDIELIITDTGIGIETERLSLIFDRFHSNDRSDLKSGEGLGIGLHLTKELIELHHGSITVDSQLGKGSTFTVVLPKNQVANDSVNKQEIREPESEIYQSSAELFSIPNISTVNAAVTTILLVEDNEDMRSYISGLLTSDIVRIMEAENGIEGKKKLIELTPDLIISDVMMPDMDGFEFARFVRSKPEYRLTPIVMLTALSGLDERIEAFEIGVSDYLNKPFNETELKARIANLLALKAERDEAISYMGEGEESGDSDEVQTHFIEKLKAYVKERITDSEITSDDLCQAVNMSRRQLFRKIKTETGFTPGAFVREIKLLEARKLIEERKGNTVSEISYAVGFSTPSHFAKIFEERFGLHPKELLK